MSLSFSPAKAAEDRISHPIAGPIIWSFLIWNWPIMLWIVGAVPNPKGSIDGIAEWLAAAASWRIFWGPIGSALLFIFAVPILMTKFQRFELWLSREKAKNRGESDNLSPVAGGAFNDTIVQMIQWKEVAESVQKEFVQIGATLAEIHSWVDEVRSRNPNHDGQLDDVSRDLAKARKKFEGQVNNLKVIDQKEIERLKNNAMVQRLKES